MFRSSFIPTYQLALYCHVRTNIIPSVYTLNTINIIRPKGPSDHIPKKFIIFDWDGTLMNETLFPQVPKLLDELKRCGYHLSVASFNPFVEFYCERYGLKHYFDIIISKKPHKTRKKDKSNYIEEIIKYYKSLNIDIHEDQILFIDDMYEALQSINRKCESISCVHVNGKYGVQLQDIINYL